jgi:hypothetical protein
VDKMGFELRQAFLEIRFSQMVETDKVMGELNNISNNLRRLYGSSNFDFNNKAFIMNNPIGAYNCILAPDRLAIDSSATGTIDGFCKIAEDTLKEFREYSFLDNIQRVGFRTFHGKDYESLDIANGVIAKSFDIHKTSAKYFSNVIGDVRVGFSVARGDYATNFNFSAATNREMQLNNGDIRIVKEKYCVLADMDTFIDKSCKYSNIFEYLTNFKIITYDNIKTCSSVL